MTLPSRSHAPSVWRGHEDAVLANRAPKILLAEDNPGDAALIEHRLAASRMMSAQVVQVDSLASTILALTHDDFDAVILDMNLPDSDGLETIVMVLQQALDIPLIVLSGEQEERIALEAIALGAQDYILKSRVLRENLCRIVRHAIERHALRLELEKRIALLDGQRENFRALIADNADAMMVIDQAGTICFANRSAESLLERPSGSLAGSVLGIPIEGREASEVELMRSDGTALVVDMRVMATSWEERPAYIATFRDITKNKESEALLTIARQSAELSDRFKSQFLANVSHELRTPLNAIMGYAELLMMEVHGAIGSEQYLTYLNAIRTSGEELFALINRLLDLSKAEAGALELYETTEPVSGMLEEVIERYRGEVADLGLTFAVYDCSAGATLHCDVDRVRDVIGQLLSNSCKFTERGGKIRLSIDQTRDGNLEVVVSDTGIGMREEQLLRAFCPFNGSDGAYTCADGQGAGLGLLLARTFVELHGGTLHLESRFGEGTEARILFPAARVGFEREPAQHPVDWQSQALPTLALQ